VTVRIDPTPVGKWVEQGERRIAERAGEDPPRPLGGGEAASSWDPFAAADDPRQDA
jgi:hypothetical protein